MSEQVPEIEIPFIGIYTTDPDVNNAANYGIVSGTGLTPEEAFNALREAAERWSRSIVQRVWQSQPNASVSFQTKRLREGSSSSTGEPYRRYATERRAWLGCLWHTKR